MQRHSATEGAVSEAAIAFAPPVYRGPRAATEVQVAAAGVSGATVTGSVVAAYPGKVAASRLEVEVRLAGVVAVGIQ